MHYGTFLFKVILKSISHYKNLAISPSRSTILKSLIKKWKINPEGLQRDLVRFFEKEPLFY